MTVYINEYAQLAAVQFGPGQVPQEGSALAKYSITNGASSASSPLFQNGTAFIRIQNDSTSAICVSIGAGAQTAVTGKDRIPPNGTEFRAVPAGGGFSIAVINTT